MEDIETEPDYKEGKEMKNGKHSRDATDKLESARCLTNEAIQIIQDKICTATNEDVKNNLWVEHVLEPLLRIVDLFSVSMKSFEDLLQNEENGIKLELNTESTTNNSVVKSEHGETPIKLNPLDSDDDTYENFVKDDIDDNLKFEQSDELYDNSLDFSPAVPKKYKSKREGGNVEKRIKKKKKPSKLECPGYCDECHKEHRIPKEGEKKDYPCDLCDKSYICVKTLRKHKKFHAGKFKCDICGKSLTCKSVLESHINNQHKGPYPCEICGKLYNNINALSKHKVFHVKSINKTEEILKCSVCEKEFTGKRRHYYLRAHMICHSSDKPHTCDICGTSFSRPSSLYVHKKTHNEEIFSCDICGKTLKTSQTLALHKLTHADITFNCTMCEKTFSSKPGLKRHIKTHTGIGLYHCELCEKSFDLKDKLTRHERTHSGVKPFYCEACNMSFYSKGELTKHKKLSIRHADNMKKMGGGEGLVDEFKNETAD